MEEKYKTPTDCEGKDNCCLVEQQKPKRVISRRRQPAEPEYEVNPVLLDKVVTASGLPTAYSFEIVKTVQRSVKLKAKHIALQMPEGLLMFATVLADVLKRLTPNLTQVSVLGDVTYGACCVDDITAKELGCELLVHYGHSCLVPLQHTAVPVLYVFVDVHIDIVHMVECLKATLQHQRPHIYLLGTVQFRHAFVIAQEMLQESGFDVSIPQVKPLSPGEVLGCTSPVLGNGVVCFVADGRFHLEATLISNPQIDTYYRYDPYSQTLTEEEYDHAQMHEIRKNSIEKARSCQSFGIILGTLGRQGNPAIVQRVQQVLGHHKKKSFIMLVSEISPSKLEAFPSIDCWVQVACPRLSVDWGHNLSSKPVLTPYELFVALHETEWKETYPMDYYSTAGGPWGNYHEENRDRQWK